MLLGNVAEVLLAVPAVILLFLASTVFFDVVHWRLHRMLGSRSAVLRAIAWPHGIHHRWIDRRLRVNWEYQSKNVWCHLVLEYATHLVFTALLGIVLPLGLTIGLASLQTLVFLLLLRERGLDLNHRPQPIVEVAQPGFVCPVAYHAQHHAYPDAFFSSYVKMVDAVLGTALDPSKLCIGLVGGDSTFGQAVRGPLRVVGARELVDLESSGERTDIDVLVLCEPDADLELEIETFLRTNGDRQLPPEVWAVLTSPTNEVARHYYQDRRLLFRPILVRPDAGEAAVARAARRAIRFIVRGAHVPRMQLDGSSSRAFRRTRPLRPAGVPKIRCRASGA